MPRRASASATGPFSGLALILFVALVAYTAATKRDIQPHHSHSPPKADCNVNVVQRLGSASSTYR